jgi:hypothetical protein
MQLGLIFYDTLLMQLGLIFYDNVAHAVRLNIL